MNENDVIYLLACYMIVADSEINDKEIKTLLSLPNYTSFVKDEEKKIFSDDSAKIEISKLLRQANLFPTKTKRDLISFLLRIAYSTCYFGPQEGELMEKIILNINFDRHEYEELKKQQEQNIEKYEEKEVTWQNSLREKLYQLLYEINDTDEDKDRYGDVFLSGKSFVSKIKSIAEKSNEDLKLSIQYITELKSVYCDNCKKITDYSKKIISGKRNDDLSNQLEKGIKNLNKSIEVIINTSLEKNKNTLDKKRSTIDYFTIGFIGRTKAGKSTFHKVITEQKTDDIGVGKLRTTRYNRVFNWENIRIIDTPGLGAPGGKSDEEVAKSIIDESDLICFLVTNDSIQQTEFEFLRLLKNQNKPLLIILNVKQNLENETRRKSFLKNPRRWIDNESDQQSIQGHINRINTYVANFYEGKIDVIPIMLLAAKMKDNPDLDNETKELLYKSSNITEYIRKVKQSIFDSGHVKKTQNIIDGCNYNVYGVLKEIDAYFQNLNLLQKSLRNKKKELIEFLDKEHAKRQTSCSAILCSTYNEIRTGIKEFASRNGDTDNKHLESRWKEFYNDNKYNEKLQSKIEGEFKSFESGIKERIEECMTDLKIIFDSRINTDADIESASTFDTRNIWKIGVSILTGVALCFTPLGWAALAVTAVGAIVGWIGNNLFKSRKERIEEKKQKIVESLTKSINENELTTKVEVNKNLDNFVSSTKNKIIPVFDTLIDNLSNLIAVLDNLRQTTSMIHTRFNVVMLYRVLEHFYLLDIKGKLTHEMLIKFENDNKVQIDRNFDRNEFNIQTQISVPQEIQNKMIELLQTKIIFKNENRE
ncbi:GTPase Era [termite gut metagenome]|uniref:GTPase Era n=1 Tax=termite gut metagenome TaxID=433724 RepID=A0A5J4R6P4_9ZZZZ